MELRKMILHEVPESKIYGKIGRNSSFEITLNNKIIYSKLHSGTFPDSKYIVESVLKERDNSL
jgi:selT/selW/selH-like putative selenoprotein